MLLTVFCTFTNEAEYAFRLKKKVIPLRFQRNYHATSWLGLLVDNRTIIDCSMPAKIKENIELIVKELVLLKDMVSK